MARVYEHREIDAEKNYDVWYVSPECTKRVIKDKPDYLEWVASGNIPEVILYKAPPPPHVKTEEEKMAEAVSVNLFRKIDIRRAFRSLGKEADLDALIKSNVIFEKDWLDSDIISLSDPVVSEALQSAEFDVNLIKVAIYNSKVV